MHRPPPWLSCLLLIGLLRAGVARAGPAEPAAMQGDPPAERLTLQAALQRALQRNPSVAVAMAEIYRAQGLLQQARAGSLPTLTGNGTYTRLDNDRTLNDRIISGANQLSANLTLAVPLIYPQHWLQWAHARDNVEVARVSAAEVRRQVAIATARAYLTGIAQHRAIDVAERARDTARAHLAFAHSRYAGGIGTRLDEVRAAQEQATDEAQVQTAHSALARDTEALGVLVGAEGPVDSADEGPLGAAPALTEALAEAQARRTDIKAYEAREHAARRVSCDSWADYMPYLVGNFQPFYQNPPTLTQPLLGWQAQLILTVPFYDGGFRYGAAKERKALWTESRVNLEGALRQARSDVRAAFVSAHRADAALIAARDAARLASEALKLANLAYRAGATTNLEVIDAERQARDAETAATVAEDTARQARLDLLIASGRFP